MLSNNLLIALGEQGYERLRAQLVPINLPLGEKVQLAGQKIEYVWFIEEGISSMIARSPRGEQIEVALTGRESGMNFGIALGDDISSLEVLIQAPGRALRMDVNLALAAMEEQPRLRSLLLRASQTLFVQATQTALANNGYTVEERLARWLLMCHDRVDGDELNLTHHFLSLMLGVRRPSVTVAIHVLEGERLLTARRARLKIRDRAGLEEYAAEIYGAPEAVHARLLAGMTEDVTGLSHDKAAASG